MIFSGIIKNWKLILDIALVLGIILLAFLWNPFNIFGKGLKLQDTSNMVSQIKEIGELVTAEYYGEVIASHEEAKLEIIGIDSIENLGHEHYRLIKKAILGLYQTTVEDVDTKFENKSNKRRKRERDRAIRKLKSKIEKKIVEIFAGYFEDNSISKDIYHSVILFVGKYEHGSKIKVKKFVRKSENDRYADKILGQVLSQEFDRIERYDQGDLAFSDYLQSGFSTHARFTDFFYEYKGLSNSRKDRKVELAIIGRGSVKAGFKFDKLSDENVVYDKDQQTIYFFGFNAEILDEDINPWFIPERKVPGFQIIAENNGTFDKMKELKIHCVKKLRHNAEVAGILEQAQRNGEEALREFFSLLTGDDIKKVVFRKETLAYQTDEILKDSVISFNETVLIDSIVSRSLADMNGNAPAAIKARKEKLLISFISELKDFDILLSKGEIEDRFPYNYYNRHISRLLLDSVITQSEIDFIQNEVRHSVVSAEGSATNYIKPPPEYGYWFSDSLSYFNEFNEFVDHLISTPLNKGFLAIDSINGPVQTLSSKPKKFNSQIGEINNFVDGTAKTSYRIIGDTVLYFKLDSIAPPTHLKYPIQKGVAIRKGFIEIDSLVEWYQEELLPTSTDIHGFTNVILQNDTLSTMSKVDMGLFEYPIDNLHFSIDVDTVSVRLWSGTDTLIIIKADFFQKPVFTYFEPKDKNDSALFRMNKEAYALRDYLIERNTAFNKIGPVMKLRRSVDDFFGKDETFSEIRESVDNWANGIRKRFNQ